MKARSFVALCGLVAVVAAACGSSTPANSPTPFPTLITLSTPTPSFVPTLPPVASPTPDTQASEPPAPLPLPTEFTRVPKAPRGYSYTPTSRQGALTQGTPKTIKLGTCGLTSPIDIDGSVWDPVYGDDGQGGPLNDAQLNDLRSSTRVTLTLIDANTLQLVTRHGATITLTRHDGSRRYPSCP